MGSDRPMGVIAGGRGAGTVAGCGGMDWAEGEIASMVVLLNVLVQKRGLTRTDYSIIRTGIRASSRKPLVQPPSTRSRARLCP